MSEHKLPVSRACEAVKVSRTTYYKPNTDRLTRDSEVIEALQELVSKHRRWGFWKCFDRLRFNGKPWNHKRVYRVYTELGLNQPRRTKKRLPKRERQSMETKPIANEVWSIDFMSDTLYSGRRFRTFNVMDDGFREGLGIEVDTSLPAKRVIKCMERIIEWRGKPRAIRCDNGPEFISEAFSSWCDSQGIKLMHIQPGKPNQNPYIERFNRTYRTEILNAYLFDNLDQVRDLTDTWLQTYNEERPHDSLGGIPPSEYRRGIEQQSSTF